MRKLECRELFWFLGLVCEGLINIVKFVWIGFIVRDFMLVDRD